MANVTRTIPSWRGLSVAQFGYTNIDARSAVDNHRHGRGPPGADGRLRFHPPVQHPGLADSGGGGVHPRSYLEGTASRRMDPHSPTQLEPRYSTAGRAL